eukprot:COSAG06_NODE_5446_length_3479_cov_1.700888_3_plen_49_part_00
MVGICMNESTAAAAAADGWMDMGIDDRTPQHCYETLLLLQQLLLLLVQ